MLILESTQEGAVWDLYNGSFQFFLLDMPWRIDSRTLHNQGSLLNSLWPINIAEQMSIERSRDFGVGHYPVVPSQSRLLKARLRQRLAQGHVYLAGHQGPACWSSEDSTWSDRKRMGHQSLVTAGAL